jgi:guanylate kinase
VSGPGGAGKGTLVSRVVASDPALWLSRSWTTRPRRPGETGDEYHFVDEATFREKAARGGFLEWVSFNDHLYGTPQPEPPPGADVLLEIDIQGAEIVRSKHPDAVVVMVVAPSDEDRAARLRARGDDEAEVQRRMELGRRETERGRAIADHVVVNDDVSQATERLASIIASARRAARGGPGA